MKRKKTRNRPNLGITVLAIIGCGVTVLAQPVVVQQGDDAWRTGGDGTEFIFGDPDNDFPTDPPPPIPPDFFDLGSDPFEGVLTLVGSPLTTNPPGALGPTDTVVQRLQDTAPLNVGDSDTVDIEIIGLSLVSSAPITVTYNGGLNPELWDVRVALSSSAAQQIGSMTITRTNPDGGTFESSLPVTPEFVFIRQTDLAERTLDCGLAVGTCDLVLENPAGEPNYWVVIGGPGGIQRSDFNIVAFAAGVQILGGGETDGSSNFQGGLDAEGDPGAGGPACGARAPGVDEPKCRKTEEAHKFTLIPTRPRRHIAYISSTEDSDGNGVPDVCEGACCETDGSCQVRAHWDCEGEYLGGLTSCEPEEACCMPDGCIDTCRECCSAAGGQPQADGSACSDPNVCCGDGVVQPNLGEECDPPGNIGQCPDAGVCEADCICPLPPGKPALPGWAGLALAGLLVVVGGYVFGRKRRSDP